MIDRTDPDIGKKIDISTLASGLNGRITTFYSIQQTPIKNPWIGLHDGTVCDGISLAKWELQIPQYGCACKKDYAIYKAENPPDFSSPKSLWLWGVALHNWVNRKLNKPEITIEDARKIWSQNNDLSQVGSEDLL